MRLLRILNLQFKKEELEAAEKTPVYWWVKDEMKAYKMKHK